MIMTREVNKMYNGERVERCGEEINVNMEILAK